MLFCIYSWFFGLRSSVLVGCGVSFDVRGLWFVVCCVLIVVW